MSEPVRVGEQGSFCFDPQLFSINQLLNIMKQNLCIPLDKILRSVLGVPETSGPPTNTRSVYRTQQIAPNECIACFQAPIQICLVRPNEMEIIFEILNFITSPNN